MPDRARDIDGVPLWELTVGHPSGDDWGPAELALLLTRESTCVTFWLSVTFWLLFNEIGLKERTNSTITAGPSTRTLS